MTDTSRAHALARMAVVVFPTGQIAQEFRCAVFALGGSIVADPDELPGDAVSDDDPCQVITMSADAVDVMLYVADNMLSGRLAAEPEIPF